MFVSSYSTYISTNNSEKSTLSKTQKSKEQTTSFLSHLGKNDVLVSKQGSDLPLDYISNYRTFSNKQKLQDEVLFEDKVKYNKNAKMQNAKTAYADNSKMFSLFMEPKTTQSQTLHVDTNTKQTAINTYLENDKYYQITA